MSKGTILVTGGTGFVGSHIVSQLLEKGYTVRATARSALKLHSIFPRTSSEQLQIVEAPSLTSDHSEALKGVDALIHTASANFFGETTGKEIFSGAYEDAIALVKQAVAAGVKKVVVTGTFAALFDADFKAAFGNRVLTEKDFGSVTPETIDVNKGGMQIYIEAKTLADKEIWKMARAYSEIDFTVILPPAVFGPQLTPFTSSSTSLGTNDFIRELFAPEHYPANPVGHMIDVRDVARAHVLALDIPPVSGRDKRFIISNGTFKWKDVATLIRSKKPELAGRLPKENSVPVLQTNVPLDTTFAEEVLGLKRYIPQEETFLAAVDVILEWEKKFANKA